MNWHSTSKKASCVLLPAACDCHCEAGAVGACKQLNAQTNCTSRARVVENIMDGCGGGCIIWLVVVAVVGVRARGKGRADPAECRLCSGIGMLEKQQEHINCIEHEVGVTERPDTYQAIGDLDGCCHHNTSWAGYRHLKGVSHR